MQVAVLTMGFILANCVSLAFENNSQGFATSRTGRITAVCDYTFTALFSLECLMKTIALGFVAAPRAYLRDPWNLVDFVVVLLSFLNYTPGFQNLTSLRTVRVLRALRTVTRVEGMRVIVVTLIKSLPMLADVAVLLSFEFIIFGILGVDLFRGKMRNQCASLQNPTPSCVACYNTTGSFSCPSCSLPEVPVWRFDPNANYDDMCSQPRTTDYPHRIINHPHTHGRACPGDVEFSWCVGAAPDPDYGITSFDNILWAWLSIFQCVTMTNWTDMMYQLQDSVSQWVWIYFVLLVVLTAYFAMNLAVAVLFTQFADNGPAKNAFDNDSRFGTEGVLDAPPPGAEEALENEVAEATAEEEEGDEASSQGSLRDFEEERTDTRQGVLERADSPRPSCESLQSGGESDGHGDQAWPGSELGGLFRPPYVNRVFVHRAHADEGGSSTTEPPTQPLPTRLSLLSGSPLLASGLESDLNDGLAETSTPSPWVPAPASAALPGAVVEANGEAQPLKEDAAEGTAVPQSAANSSALHSPLGHLVIVPPTIDARLRRWVANDLRSEGADEDEHASAPASPRSSRPSGRFSGVRRLRRSQSRVLQKSSYVRARIALLRFVYSKTMEEISMAVIVTNTVMMAAVYYRMGSELQQQFDETNYVFTGYFLAEMVLKLTAVGPGRYFSLGVNRFDTLVVLFSCVDVVVTLTRHSNDSANGLSVLRSLRLVRIFKLARRWTQLNDILVIIGKSITSLSYLSLVLLLHLFIFALLGQQLFSFYLDFCDATGVPGATTLCPPGLSCGSHFDCFAPCSPAQAGVWITYQENVTNYGNPLLGSMLAPVDAVLQNGFPVFDGTRYTLGGLCLAYQQGAPPGAPVPPGGSAVYLTRLGPSYTPFGNFDDLFQSIISIFRVLTFDNWDNLLWDCMRATNVWYALFFVVAICLGNYLILNLFLAILLDNFGRQARLVELERLRSAAGSAAGGGGKESAAGEKGLLSHLLARGWATGHAVKALSAQQTVQLVGHLMHHASPGANIPRLSEHLASGPVQVASRLPVEAEASAGDKGEGAGPGAGNTTTDGNQLEALMPPPPVQTRSSAVLREEEASGYSMAEQLLSSAREMMPESPAEAWKRAETERAEAAAADLLDFVTRTQQRRGRSTALPLGRMFTMRSPRDDDTRGTPGRVHSSAVSPEASCVQPQASDAGAGSRAVVQPSLAEVGDPDSFERDSSTQQRQHQSTPTLALEGNSLLLFGPESGLRLALVRVAQARWFETIIMTAIALSSITLVLDKPSLEPQSTLKQACTAPDMQLPCASIYSSTED